MASSSWPLIIYAIYVPPLCALYVIELIIINRSKYSHHFSSTFYKFFTIAGIVDLLAEACAMMSMRIPLYPGWNDYAIESYSKWWMTPLYASNYYLPAVQEYINICIALNRATAVLAYSKHDWIWRYGLWPCAVAIFGLPFITSYHLLDASAFFNCARLGVNGSFGVVCLMDYDPSKRPWVISNSFTSSVLFMTTASTSLAIYIITFIALKWRLSTLQVAFWVIKPTDLNDLGSFIFQIPWVMDIKLLSSPVLALIFSKSFRTIIVRGLRKGTITPITPPRTLTTHLH